MTQEESVTSAEGNIEKVEQSSQASVDTDRRDAIGTAIEELKQKETAPQAAASEAPQAAPQKDTAQVSKPQHEAPAEWTKEEKEDFNQSSPKQQEAALRLHKSRHSVLENIKAEKAELDWVKEITKEVDWYLKSQGNKRPAKEEIIDAIRAVREIRENPVKGSADVLKAKGYQVPKELLELDKESQVDPEKIALQKRLDALESRAVNEEISNVRNVLSSAWEEFANTKNAAGGPRFPDILREDEGSKILARNIGSLVDGVTPLSKQFIASCEARIPDLTIPKLVVEAYRYFGGSVDDSPAPRTQESQKLHIAKSSRAASSQPGRSSLSTSTGKTKTYKNYRDAAAAALAELREREG